MNIAKYELKQAMSAVKHIHFVGVGGVGMSGIAELFANLGFKVSGSDQKQSLVTDRLQGAGLTVQIGHSAENVNGADVVVVSTAISEDNPEKVAALKLGIMLIRRAEMLAELMRFKYGIAVSGTHGKTTTTSLIASVLTEGGVDPTYVIGGKLMSSAVNAKLGEGKYLVAEADESDASFLHLNPMLSIVTNIDEDHMDTYDGSVEKLHSTFVDFIHNLPFYGKVIACVDDPGVRMVLPRIHRQVVSYGIEHEADVRAVQLRSEGEFTHFTVQRHHKDNLEVTLHMPGQHNVLNALAAIATATELGVDDQSIAYALKTFDGIGRRFQQYGDFLVGENTVKMVDDYGHHPREVAATIKAARLCCPEKRLFLVFQPHRYSRTRDLFDDFVQVLSAVDSLVLLEVYAAGEEKIVGACARSLSKAIRTRGEIEPVVVDTVAEVIPLLDTMVQDHDLLLLSGAGDVGSLAPSLAKKWEPQS